MPAWIRTTALVAALGSFAAPANAQLGRGREQPPELILFGGKIFTADSTRPWAEALAIRGDRIVAVGTNDQIRALAGPSTRMIPLLGRTVVPGINDAHDHLGEAEVGVAFSVDRSPTPDPPLAPVLDSLRALVRRVPKGTWLRTTVGPRILDDSVARRATLDAVAPDHPVSLHSWTGHGLVANSRALRELEIDESTREITGGRIERDAEGRPTGLLEEYAQWSARRRLMSSLPKPALVAALRARLQDRLSLGVTSVQNMASTLDPLVTVRVFREVNPTVRVRLIPFPIPDGRSLRADEWRGVPSPLTPMVTSSGRKWIVDGTPLERLAFMRAPYADRPQEWGRMDFDPRALRLILGDALRERQQIMLHVSGDSSLRAVFSAMQALAPDSAWRRLRPRIEHGDWLGGDVLPVAKRLGVILVQNPTHFTIGPVVRVRYGARADSMFPLRSVHDAGVPVALGSDGAPSPWLDIMLATMHPARPSEALTREQAVIAYTRTAAYAEGTEHDKGTLAPGMLADLAVLSADVFTIPAGEIAGVVSVMTFVGGRLVYRRL